LLEVESDLKAVSAGQEAMERKLALLETHQKEVHDALSSIEQEAEKLCALERPLLDADAMERDRLYSRAEAVSQALLLVSNDLQSAVLSINEANAASYPSTGPGGGGGGGEVDPVSAIVKILNNQLRALTQLDHKVSELGLAMESTQMR
jgi:nuclear pore complex protein Nup62